MGGINDFGSIPAEMRMPTPSDLHIDYSTYRALIAWVKTIAGRTDGADTFLPSQFTWAKITARVRDTPVGPTPPATAVFLYDGVEQVWNSTTLAFEDKAGGILWDGTAFNRLRLFGNPGFAGNNYDLGPLLTDAVVPVFRARETGVQTTPDATRPYRLDVWFIINYGEDSIVHPFKCTVSPSNPDEITVGATRGTGTDHLKEHITIHKGGTTVTTILKAAPETIVITADSYVYYDVDVVADTATLAVSVAWPPAGAQDDHEYLQLGFVKHSGDITSIGQLAFSNFALDPEFFTTFLSLTDTPSSYVAQAKKILNVNDAETAVEFDTLIVILKELIAFVAGNKQVIFHPVSGDPKWENLVTQTVVTAVRKFKGDIQIKTRDLCGIWDGAETDFITIDCFESLEYSECS